MEIEKALFKIFVSTRGLGLHWHPHRPVVHILRIFPTGSRDVKRRIEPAQRFAHVPAAGLNLVRHIFNVMWTALKLLPALFSATASEDLIKAPRDLRIRSIYLSAKTRLKTTPKKTTG